MKTIFLLFLLAISSCSSQKPQFSKDRTCSKEALKYLKNPRNIEKRALKNPKLIQEMARTSGPVQKCYEDFIERRGRKEFNTCLVVGIDEDGGTEFYNFGSQEVKLDQDFLNCTRDITRNIPYSHFGQNYILIQSYQFYVSGL